MRTGEWRDPVGWTVALTKLKGVDASKLRGIDGTKYYKGKHYTLGLFCTWKIEGIDRNLD